VAGLPFDNIMKTHTLILLGALAFASTPQAATVSLFAEGTIDQAWDGAYPFVDAGDSFRLSVSYFDGWADTNPTASLGVYLPEDLTITLDILGEGTAFHSFGGSVNVATDPGEFPVIGILSTLRDGNALFFLFRDDDRSAIFDDSLPTAFGSIADYDAVGFSVIKMPAMWPSTSNPVDGTISFLAVPEPHVLSLAGVGAALLFALRSKRYKTKVEPCAVPNGDPATPVGNAGVTEEPSSES
jgi:hypothetical protein